MKYVKGAIVWTTVLAFCLLVWLIVLSALGWLAAVAWAWLNR